MKKSVKRKCKSVMDAWSKRMHEQMSKAVASACEDALIHGTGGVFFIYGQAGESPVSFDVKHIPFDVWRKP